MEAQLPLERMALVVLARVLPTKGDLSRRGSSSPVPTGVNGNDDEANESEIVDWAACEEMPFLRGNWILGIAETGVSSGVGSRKRVAFGPWFTRRWSIWDDRCET